ncbi:AarF/ABC1/UbiB kinase family protein [Myxococcus llanfairpwllgwyngyllgogerychwyrndrobwllllantysiliogogogochensis]|uniref:AarF/ABC1/UbiB kinase family protein n=1 Tax=Myxococcus llanfairpwllgwyngyllgogerychwyrndrobwllllantysiliogogogochensis TaxID=2590453 RepID=A0A540X5I4_9BACT|nr:MULTISPECIES: AarF/ABC1/UbiB kinase family protein [Myxococcus]NTX09758.1 AarF/ABC1/UbiB kinase family protein [Myxococcus sp. CA056]TQF16517.1 AarF/ABC1/UbiB kinase family protein [Myxococcus llanfairpwllgwyngyllgogerychwyrndrobwllllantysiliogogogochensis]
MASDSDDSLPPQGRFTRLRKLAGLSMQVGTDVLMSSAKRLAGGTPELLSKSSAEKLVATLGELKGAAMKLGQAISMDPDLLTPEVRQVLARLQNQAPAMSYDMVTRVVRQELGAAPEDAFREFSREPLAAASLGQVHRAVLEDGRVVAVKVQYPGIAESLTHDMENLGLVVKTVSKASRLMDGSAYFNEFRDELLLELDYRREASLAEGFARGVAELKDLYVPQVIASHSAERVLTLELLEGPTLKDWVTTVDSNDERFRVSRQLIRATYGPFFGSGEIHADPHPGNFMVMPDGRLGLLDFGSIKRFSPRFVDANRRMFLQSMRLEPMDILRLSQEVGFTVELPGEEAADLIREVLHIAGRPMRLTPYDYMSCEITRDMRNHFTRNAARFLKIKPPPEAVMFFRSTGGLAQNLRLIGARGDFRGVFLEMAELLS